MAFDYKVNYLIYIVDNTVKVVIFANFTQNSAAQIKKPVRIFAIFCMHISDV